MAWVVNGSISIIYHAKLLQTTIPQQVNYHGINLGVVTDSKADDTAVYSYSDVEILRVKKAAIAENS